MQKQLLQLSAGTTVIQRMQNTCKQNNHRVTERFRGTSSNMASYVQMYLFIAEYKLTNNQEYGWTLHLLDWVQSLAVDMSDKMFYSFSGECDLTGVII